MSPDRRRLSALAVALLVLVTLGFLAGPLLAQEAKEPAYRAFPYLGSRLAIWVIAQLHLDFAAFILGVPIFAAIIEFMGWKIGTDRPEGRRYDWLAHQFVKLTFAAFSTTALLGGLLLFFLITLYPRFWTYMSAIFAPTMWLYAALFFLETFVVYLWYYGWDWLSGPRKGLHVALGILSNLLGTSILVVSNSWLTFMMSPAGVDPDTGKFTGTLWQAMNNYTWMPINIHRLIANIVFGGTIAGAYAALRFLGAKTDEERARYDWMGYVGNFVALSALMLLPFAGYWLGFEIYGFNQTMGITMMGGFMSWLWIVQAILIGVLFLGSNYYLWLGMERIPGAERFRPSIKYLLLVLALGFMVWATPRSLIVSLAEVRAMGGTDHRFLRFFGVMTAKNTAVNLMILTTFLSYLLYRRANKLATVGWARTGMGLQWLVLALAAATVVGLGLGGYFVEAIVRIRRLSPLQVSAVLACIVIVMVIDIPLFRSARSTGPIRWGTIAPRSQYVLILLAVTFTWLMGLMGFARSGIRQHWHIYGVMQDKSPDAGTPALGYAANVITITTIVFFLMVSFIFWLGGLGDKAHAHEPSAEPVLDPGPARTPHPAPIAGGGPDPA